MKKTAQSLLDFINVFPLSIQVVPRSPISNKEAKALFEIWKGEKDEYGYHIVPQETDPTTVASLTSKEIVKSKPMSRIGSDTFLSRSLEITGKGKDIIRNIILHTEQSALENNKDPDFKYESIHRVAEQPPKPGEKIASVLNQQENQNWIQRAFKKWK